MSFLAPERVQSLEGKFVKFHDSVPRTFKLIKHKSESRNMNGKVKVVDEIYVEDMETKEEKILTANGKFMAALAKIDSQLVAGDIVKVIPEGKSFTNGEGEEIKYFDFSITKVVVDDLPAF